MPANQSPAPTGALRGASSGARPRPSERDPARTLMRVKVATLRWKTAGQDDEARRFVIRLAPLLPLRGRGTRHRVGPDRENVASRGVDRRRRLAPGFGGDLP